MVFAGERVSSSRGRADEEDIIVVPKVRLVMVVEAVCSLRSELGMDKKAEDSGVNGMDWKVFSVAKLPAKEELSKGREEVDNRLELVVDWLILLLMDK